MKNETRLKKNISTFLKKIFCALLISKKRKKTKINGLVVKMRGKKQRDFFNLFV
jgi:hypothetical protein